MYIHALFALLCSLSWAGTGIAGKLLAGAVPSLLFSFMRYFIAILCLLPFIAIREYRSVQLRHLPGLLYLGLSAVVIFNSLYFAALGYTSPTTVTLILAMHPLVTLLVTSLIGRKVPTKHQLAAFMLSFAGAAMVITKGHIGWDVFSGSIGEFLVLAAVVVQVSYTLTLKSLSGHFSGQFITFATGVTGIMFLMPLCMNGDFAQAIVSLSNVQWGLLAYVGCFATAFGIVLYSNSVKNIGVPLTSLVVFGAQPIFASILSYFFLGEVLSVWQVAGGTCVITALCWGLMKHKA